MRPLLRASAATAAGALAVALAATPALAATTTKINPSKLSRGADVSVPHLEGSTVVDGAVRVQVKGKTVVLLGKSGTSYVVGTANASGGGGRIWRYAADGTAIALARANVYLSQLSDDGQTVISARSTNTDTTVMRAWSATTGAQVGIHTFGGYASVLDADAGKVLVGSWEPSRTLVWNPVSGAVSTIARRSGYEGDLGADVLAYYSRDPYSGGCTVVASISTGDRAWTSCTERVDAFNDDGSRMALIDLLSDGIGPSAVTVRTATGKRVATYEVVRGWFGNVAWETSTALLLDTNGPHKAAPVRCEGTDCERAGDLVATVQPRVGA